MKHILDGFIIPVKGIMVVPFSGMLFFSFFLDFSIWYPFLSKTVALAIQGGGILKLIFEQKYFLLRSRHLVWWKRFLPLGLLAVALLFFIEKAFLLKAMWMEADPSMIDTYRLYSVIFILSMLILYAIRLTAIARFLGRLELKPVQTMALSFALVILFGALLLSLPHFVVDPTHISFIDALFTATSATTVTGLTLFPISEHYRIGGQWVILFLIQLGGIGIMSFAAIFSLLASQRPHLRKEAAMREILEFESIGSFGREIRMIFAITFVLEAIGVVFLWVSFRGTTDPLFNAIFHSISAFCNAGFSLFPDNLEGYTSHLPVNATMGVLIVLGGLGFPVLNNLGQYPIRKAGGEPWKLSFHSRMVLMISGALLAFGTFALFILEYDGALADLNWFDKWIGALFHSITARTAGFNTIAMDRFSDATLFLFILLMWIGGSPGSTSGGIKTTTFGVMLATVRSLLRRREEVELFHRSLAPLAVQKTLSIAFISSALLAVLLLFLVAMEGNLLEDLMFEAVSAFSTTGLSTGITAQLSPLGKVLLILIMIIGRIGPLTLTFGLAERVSRGTYTYPEERVIIG